MSASGRSRLTGGEVRRSRRIGPRNDSRNWGYRHTSGLGVVVVILVVLLLLGYLR